MQNRKAACLPCCRMQFCDPASPAKDSNVDNDAERQKAGLKQLRMSAQELCVSP